MSTSKTLRVLTIIGITAPFLAACNPFEESPQAAYCMKTGSNDFQIVRATQDSDAVDVVYIASNLKYDAETNTFAGAYESFVDPDNLFGNPVRFRANENKGFCSTLRAVGPKSDGLPAYVEYKLL